jgi:hypothetical protein
MDKISCFFNFLIIYSSGFYASYAPENVKNVKKITAKFIEDEKTLWAKLEEKYGTGVAVDWENGSLDFLSPAFEPYKALFERVLSTPFPCIPLDNLGKCRHMVRPVTYLHMYKFYVVA